MVVAMADGNVAAGKTRSLSKTIGCPMIDKDPQMIR